MWQEKQAGLLRAEVATLLVPLAGTGDLLEVIQDNLTAQLRATTDRRSGPPWALLPVIVCDSICDQGELSIPASAAMFLLKAAAEVFDDIEDMDTLESLAAKRGRAVATNVATALLFVAETALERLKLRGVSDADIIRVIAKVNSYHLIACAGQHSDIMFSGDTLISEDRYLRMIEMKTALQLECSCHVGAVLGNGSDELIATFSDLGRCLGMAAQIANDIRGVTAGNDIVERKISLPVVYALGNSDGRARELIEAMLSEKGEALTCADEIKEMLFQTGAMQYAMIRMETYKQEAHQALMEVKASGAHIEHLSLFLD